MRKDKSWRHLSAVLGMALLFFTSAALWPSLAQEGAEDATDYGTEYYSGWYDQNASDDWYYDAYDTGDTRSDWYGDYSWYGDDPYYGGSYDDERYGDDWFYDAYEEEDIGSDWWG